MAGKIKSEKIGAIAGTKPLQAESRGAEPVSALEHTVFAAGSVGPQIAESTRSPLLEGGGKWLRIRQERIGRATRSRWDIRGRGTGSPRVALRPMKTPHWARRLHRPMMQGPMPQDSVDNRCSTSGSPLHNLSHNLFILPSLAIMMMLEVASRKTDQSCKKSLDYLELHALTFVG